MFYNTSNPEIDDPRSGNPEQKRELWPTILVLIMWTSLLVGSWFWLETLIFSVLLKKS
jgi:hypothetical protein